MARRAASDSGVTRRRLPPNGYRRAPKLVPKHGYKYEERENHKDTKDTKIFSVLCVFVSLWFSLSSILIGDKGYEGQRGVFANRDNDRDTHSHNRTARAFGSAHNRGNAPWKSAPAGDSQATGQLNNGEHNRCQGVFSARFQHL